MPAMRIGLIIIGDEILSGRRTDKHLNNLIELLNQRGLQLDWTRIVGDDPELLGATLRDTLRGSKENNDLVFSTGGIGATPDDLTRELAASALGTSTEPHPEGMKIIEAYAKDKNRELTPQHYQLITFPKGASLIPNPVNTIPGFSIAGHHVVPGFPEMAQPMMEWVLDHLYPQLANAHYREDAILVTGVGEGALIPMMESVMKGWPDVKVFSLPMMDQSSPSVELGAKGSAQAVKEVMAEFKLQLKTQKIAWQRL